MVKEAGLEGAWNADCKVTPTHSFLPTSSPPQLHTPHAALSLQLTPSDASVGLASPILHSHLVPDGSCDCLEEKKKDVTNIFIMWGLGQRVTKRQ